MPRLSSRLGHSNERMADGTLSLTLRSAASGGFHFREHHVFGRSANPKHDHEYQCIGFLIGGLGTAEFGREVWTVKPGYLNVIPAGVGHLERFGSPEIRWCGIELTAPREEIAPQAARVFSAPMQVQRGAANAIAADIYRELRLSDNSSLLALHGLALELLAALARLPRKSEDTTIPRWFARAEECIRQKFLETLSLDELAREAGVHPMHLARGFRQVTGLSVGEFARILRIERAIDLLTDRDIPLTHVAHLTGFSDQSHFTRVFKKKMGMTPGEYRLELGQR